jgi:1-acyl-sn-glycerol-3-phosphate acyltransferase
MAEAEEALVTEERPDLVRQGRERLGFMERSIVRFVRGTFEPGVTDRSVRFLQRVIGSTWIHHFTKHLRHVYGEDRLPPLDPEQSFILVSNHRSFFDLYVVFGHLVRGGLPHRIVFPVRSAFFYTSPVGLFVNGVMSFFAMYPPIFRERRKLILNATSLDELAWLLRRGGMFAGLHPEGTRKKDDDPYAFLPAQRGVGRVIHEARVPVIPVFINGLVNHLPRQVWSNFDRTGKKIVVVFGEPIDFSDLHEKPSSARVHQAIAERTLEVIGKLGQEERVRRGEIGG